MGITKRRIKKWFLMLTGKSVFHVNQTIGKFFSTCELKGYFNSLIEKVTRQPEFLEVGLMPSYKNTKGDNFVFPVAVIQYGLGCYDLYLETKEEKYFRKTFECADWITSLQNKNGSIPNFTDEHKEAPFGAMCQGEAASLLLRCFIESREKKYLDCAKKSLDFMLLDKNEGGVSSYDDGMLTLLEFTFSEPVLNGWIFALFGLFDYLLVEYNEKYANAYHNTFDNLVNSLHLFDCKYWSMYDLSGRISSPFYHRLHIAQLEALYRISNNDIIYSYLTKWKKNNRSPFKKTIAFVKKVLQKIKD